MSDKSYKPSRRVKNLSEARSIAGVTQVELAKLARVAHVTVRAIETGNQKYSDELVKKLAGALGCGFTPGTADEPCGLSLTRSDTDEDYTREWFEKWRAITERKQVYLKFFRDYNDLVADLFEAACSLDLESEVAGEENEQAFHQADTVAHGLIEQIGRVLDDETIAKEMGSVLGRNGPPYRFRGMPDHVAILSRLKVCADAIDGKGRASYLKKQTKRTTKGA